MNWIPTALICNHEGYVVESNVEDSSPLEEEVKTSGTWYLGNLLLHLGVSLTKALSLFVYGVFIICKMEYSRESKNND